MIGLRCVNIAINYFEVIDIGYSTTSEPLMPMTVYDCRGPNVIIGAFAITGDEA